MTKRNESPDPDAITNDIRHSLRVLGLLHTLGKIDAHLAWAAHDKPAAGTLLARVLGEEAAHKLQHRIERRIRQSGLSERKTLEGFNWAFQPKLDKALVLELARLDFVRRKDDLIITGKAGTGKSHILKAIALSACQQQMRVRYARCVDLLDDLYAGLADGSYPERLRGWATVEPVIDDVGLGQVKNAKTSPLPRTPLRPDRPPAHQRVHRPDFEHPLELVSTGDAHLAVAVLDRLAMRGVRIDIDGPSFRQHVAQERAKKQRRPLPGDSSGSPRT